MMAFDLMAARRFWIAETDDEDEKKKRLASNFLKYQDIDGKFADFHALRHTFITNLGRVNVSPKVAQTLARHSDHQADHANLYPYQYPRASRCDQFVAGLDAQKER